MNIIPTNEYVLCEQLNKEKYQENLNGFIYEKEDIVLYKILKISQQLQGKDLLEGDIIISNAIPTKIRIDETLYFLLNINNIAAKIS